MLQPHRAAEGVIDLCLHRAVVSFLRQTCLCVLKGCKHSYSKMFVSLAFNSVLVTRGDLSAVSEVFPV